MSYPLSIRSLSFLLAGSFTDEDPVAGLEATLQVFELGERLGFDGAWIRQQHLVPNVSSAAVFLGAASQRTRRIELGTGVIPIGYESPFRLAEDLATADVLSHGRLQVGLSAGVPPTADLLAGLVYDGDWRDYDLSHGRIARLADNLRTGFLGDADTVVAHPTGPQRPRLRPVSPGLASRLWYGAGSLKSVEWAAEHGLRLTVGNICAAAGLDTDHFATAQATQIARFRERFAGPADPRVIVGRVILPLDGADVATRRKYREYKASRHERTLSPQGGDRRVLIAQDLVGSSEEILEALQADPALAEVNELQLELPYAFAQEDYEQILSDTVRILAPELGWTPSEAPAPTEDRGRSEDRGRAE